MKKESEKILYELAAFAAVNLKEDDAKYIKERIAQIIRCEGNDSKVGKFDIYEFADKENDCGTNKMASVYFDNGLRVASNGVALIAIKSDYPKEYEGKMIKKDGKFAEGRYPNWKYVLPDTSDYTIVPIPDKKKFTDWLSKCRAESKVENDGKGKRFDDDWLVTIAPHSYIKAVYMNLLLKAADALDATEMAVKQGERAYIETEKGKALFCLVYTNYAEDEKNNDLKVLK